MIPIIWIDTGYNRRPTVLFAEHAKSLLKLDLHIFQPVDHVIRIPPQLDDNDHASFSEEVKLAPFRDALDAMNASHWLSSVRAYQNTHRGQLPDYVKLNEQLIKVHPLLSWTEKDMDAYLQRYDLPLGPEAFDPTKGETFGECGLHVQQTWN